MSLSKDMAKYRAKERITQKELANRCGVSIQTICSIETEQQTPSRLTAEKIRLVIGEEEQ